MNRGIIANHISYKGIVNMKSTIDKQIVSTSMLNSGTKDLMNLLTKALAGYDISKQVPKFINIGYANNQPQDTYTFILSRDVPLTGIVWGEAVDTQNIIQLDASASSLMLSCTITSQDKTISSFSGGKLFLLLLSNDGETVLAKIEDTDDNVIRDTYNKITVGTDLIIDWYMIFNSEVK